MLKKKILSFLLSLSIIASCIPVNFVFAETNKQERTVYIHAQGENPTETPDVSTVYTDENTDIYFAVDNPNMGDYENGIHKEPQYDMNGYTITMYFDPVYFDYVSDSFAPIDYTIPDKNVVTSGGKDENVGDDIITDLPTEVGYYTYRHGSGSEVINGKTYKSAYLTVFFNGGYVPQKKDGMLWYNLCKLPLKPLRTGSTQVFFDTSGEELKSLELFAKNKLEDLKDQTFDYTAINGGYHTIIIKDKTRPAAPTATPAEGSYTETQYVTLKAEDNCDIYYSLHGEEPILYDGKPIEITVTTTITCYAQRKTDGKKSSTVKFEYRILPKAPIMFVESGTSKKAIPNIYNENDKFTVYVSDKSVFGTINDDSEIYYTFSDISEENVTDGDNPETEWVKLDKKTQSIEITKKVKVRLITKKLEEFSDVSEYHLGIKPAVPTANKESGEYDKKLDITLSCKTTGAEIYYTTDGSDPITNGTLYDGVITIAKDTTLRAVAKFDGIYSELASYYYIFTSIDDFGVDAFYPPGVYEGSVNVTLTANNPENDIKYSTDGGNTWIDYNKTLIIDKDTVILAKAGKGDTWGDIYTFTYKIKPLPPQFAPESTQFTNASAVSIYCLESTKDNTERFELYYTLNGEDPITSNTRKKADDALDSAEINITKYTVVKAVVLKDKTTYSTVVTHSYDIVTKKPTKPLVTLIPGNYTRKIGDDKGFETKFMPVVGGTEIYYTVSYGDDVAADPIPNTAGTVKYDGTPIKVKGHMIIKAVAVNVFGIKSDIGIFEYTVTPEAPKAAPSATISGDTLPIVPVSAVKGSTVKYEINGFENEFLCENGSFYIDTQTGSAYSDQECTQPLGTENSSDLSSPAKLSIKSVLDDIESLENYYVYKLSGNSKTIAPPYADKDTGEYEEIKADDDNNLLHIKLYSLNRGDTIQYKLNNSSNWIDYGGVIKIKNDTVLQIRSEKDGAYSTVSSYVYNFVPLSPIITLESGRYVLSSNPETEIKYDDRAPTDKMQNDYRIFYRENGDKQDFPYSLGMLRSIDHTMSFKAYVKNNDTGRVSKNTIHYYIIESENSATGSVYIANPYDVSRISAALLGTGEYAKGIKLLTQNKNATIHYFYSYTLKDSTDSVTTNNLVYDNIPITVNPLMTSITITAWLEDDNGRIENSEFNHEIEFVHLNVPVTSLGNDKVEFSKGTQYTIINDYPQDENILIYYTLDNSSPADADNENRNLYAGETLTLTGAVTVKTVYMSACGKCVECKNNNKQNCHDKVYGAIGEYKYTVPTIQYTGGGGGGGGGKTVVDNTRKYTKDIFGNEHPTHISYINGYPDGSVQPDGEITREEIAAILYRITNHEYEKPFVETGKVFPDVKLGRWSAHDIEYIADKKVVVGYPDGNFKPQNNLTRAEFAALISRFAKLEETDENPFPDVKEDHWAYEDIVKLAKSGLMQGYEDGTYRTENDITRAEVMTVINKLLGRNPLDSYVKSLDFNPYTDLAKDKWYYTIVMEATVTHNYYLDSKDVEIKWEDCK